MFRFHTLRALSARAGVVWLLLTLNSAAEGLSDVQTSHLFSEADAVEMTSLGDIDYNDPLSMRKVSQVSPDGKKLIVILRRGIIRSNTNEYSLLMWNLDDFRTRRQRVPTVLLKMESSSNREAISSVSWLDDDETILFLGENPGENHQLFRLNTRTGQLGRLTPSSVNVVSYAVSRSGASLVYVVEPPPRELWDAQSRQFGLAVGTQSVEDLILGRGPQYDSHATAQVFSATGTVDGGRPVRLLEDAIVEGSFFSPSLSPDGSHAVLMTYASPVPKDWARYSDPVVKLMYPKEPLDAGDHSNITQLELVGVETGRRRLLIDAPEVVHGIETRWAPDGQSVVAVPVLLPLVNESERRRGAWGSKYFAAEIGLEGEIRPIVEVQVADERWSIRDWKSQNQITLSRKSNGTTSEISYRRTGKRWFREPTSPVSTAPIAVRLAEGLNLPPKLMVSGGPFKRERLLLDLNPQLEGMRLGRIEEIRWKVRDGTTVRGGVYYPPDYRSGRRYPLVIQTHGFDPQQFAVDGIFATAFAAQAMASRNIVVLQAWDFAGGDYQRAWNDYLRSTNGRIDEFKLDQAVYESAIDHLDSMGIIDRNRVGIIGFSITCWSVKYLLTHPHAGYRFAAASISDGFDGGYLLYLLLANRPEFAQELETYMGVKPVGEGLKTWMKESPGFNIDKVDAPVRLVPLTAGSTLTEWQWFATMRRLNKPVEMIVVEDGSHILQRPWDRLIDNGGNVDWFDFWLNGNKDPVEGKAEQYRRWERLRAMNLAREATPVVSVLPGVMGVH
jgi:dipeptidyl aminopeptidase/acylaminoacyl peptidase